MLSISQVAAASGAEAGTVRAWMNRYAFNLNAAGKPGKYRWTTADALMVAIIQRLSADFGCDPPTLVDRLNMVVPEIRVFVGGFGVRVETFPTDSPAEGPWLVLTANHADLTNSDPEGIAATWRLQWLRFPDRDAPESFLALNVGALLLRVRHNLQIAGAEIE